MFDVRITKQAKEQLAEIVDYISEELCAPQAAMHLLDRLESSISSLTEYPERFQLIDDEPWRSEGIRRIVVNNFLVYYWINISDRRVHVVAIIYSKRNQLEQLRHIDINESPQ